VGHGLARLRRRAGRPAGPRRRHRLHRDGGRCGAHGATVDGPVRRGRAGDAPGGLAGGAGRAARPALPGEHLAVPRRLRRPRRAGPPRLAPLPVAEPGHRLPAHPAADLAHPPVVTPPRPVLPSRPRPAAPCPAGSCPAGPCPAGSCPARNELLVACVTSTPYTSSGHATDKKFARREGGTVLAAGPDSSP